MKPLRIAVTGGRGRLAPLWRLICAKGIRKSCPSHDRLEIIFEQITLLVRTPTLADLDAILHMGWSTVPLTSEERPGI